MRRFLRNLNNVARRINRALVISSPTANSVALTLESTDPGTFGPQLQFYHNSSSPAIDDVMGALDFYGNNSSATKVRFGSIQCVATNITAGTENAKITFTAMEAGVEQIVATFGNGLIVGNAAGGDPGFSRVNASEYQSNGVILPNSIVFTSTQQTISNAGLLTMAHGMSAAPRLVLCQAICLTTEGGWAVNDVVEMSTAGNGFGVYVDATNVYVRFNNAANPCQYFNKTTGAVFTMTNANWRLIFRAYN